MPDSLTDGIVEPLAAVNPLLGVIALIAILIVGYLVHEQRKVTLRLRDVQDREIQGLRDFLGILSVMEDFVQSAKRDSENEREFRAECKTLLASIKDNQHQLEHLIRERSAALGSSGGSH